MSGLFSFIKNLIIKFFKLINYVRLFTLNAFFILIVLIVIISVNTQENTVVIENNSFLKLDLNGFLVEQKKPINISQQISNELSGFGDDTPKEIEVQEIINLIKHAQNDTRIIGITLELDGLRSGSIDQLTSIGNALIEFKSADKPVLAYSENYTQTQYYLAAYADHVSLAPNGFILLQGYAVNRLYFKELLQKLKITPHIFKVGTYKSFVEPFTESEMSQYSKDANSHWLNQLWRGYIDHVLTQRNGVKTLSEQSINPTLKQLKRALINVQGDSAQYALAVGLVDKLEYREDFIKQTKLDINEESLETHQLEYQTYASTFSSMTPLTGSQNQVAVIYGTGEIVSGYSDGQSIADKSFNKLIQKAINNDKIKAVVLRLDTPGGSAFASENIRQKLLALKNSGKKVVVSMGAVSASGGYWIASSADKIIASPTTLTGSIGIFGMFATADKTLKKLGINQDGVSTNALANIGVTQPLSPEVAEIFQLGIEHGYAQFLSVVAEGRDMTTTEVDNVAQGRVWTGIDALENGLVDEIGDLDTAIDIAANLSELSEFDIIAIKPNISSKQAFINEILSGTVSYFPKSMFSHTVLNSIFLEINNQTNFVQRINDPQNKYVYCTTCKIQ